MTVTTAAWSGFASVFTSTAIEIVTSIFIVLHARTVFKPFSDRSFVCMHWAESCFLCGWFWLLEIWVYLATVSFMLPCVRRQCYHFAWFSFDSVRIWKQPVLCSLDLKCSIECTKKTRCKSLLIDRTLYSNIRRAREKKTLSSTEAATAVTAAFDVLACVQTQLHTLPLFLYKNQIWNEYVYSLQTKRTHLYWRHTLKHTHIKKKKKETTSGRSFAFRKTNTYCE